jgi:hypothetical protein
MGRSGNPVPNSNIELLKEVAKRLGPLLNEMAFVRRCTTSLFTTAVKLLPFRGYKARRGLLICDDEQ